MSDHSDYKSFLAGFILGGITGALVALLLAPRAGRDTRAWIKEKSIEVRDRAWQAAEEAQGRPAYLEKYFEPRILMAPESSGAGGGFGRHETTGPEPSEPGEGRPKNRPEAQ